MGGFLDVDGRLTRAAVLNKATLTLQSGGSGWLFPPYVSVGVIARQVGVRPESIKQEAEAAETDGNPSQSKKGRKPGVNSAR